MHDTISLAEKALAVTWGLRTPARDDLRLVDPVDLGGSTRSRVLRCRVEHPGESDAESLRPGERLPTTVIVKHFVSDTDAFVRESTGLELHPRTPRLLAHDQEHRLVVMSDLGDLPTLADLLLGDDPDAAREGARTWARELGRATGATRDRVAEARHQLAGIDPWDVDADLSRGLDSLIAACALGGERPLTVGVGSGVRESLESELATTRHLRTPGTAAILSPTDTCPDNAVLGADGWWFLDLEGTDVEHAAFAAAYAMLPFATCWCVFDPPSGLTDMLVAEFSAGLAEHASDVVAEPGWELAVRQACAVYIVLITGWLWNGAAEGRPSVGPEGRSPSYRQLLVSRWRWGALNLRDDFPALAAAMATAATRALETWGLDVEPTGYRAFR